MLMFPVPKRKNLRRLSRKCSLPGCTYGSTMIVPRKSILTVGRLRKVLIESHSYTYNCMQVSQ